MTAAPPPFSPAISRLWLPRLSLTSCLRAVISRDTRGVALPAEQRFNHFPASPLCSISWWFHGTSEMLAAGAAATLASPRQGLPDGVRAVFAGPYNHPLVSWNPGPVHGMMLLLQPDAVHQLLGIDPYRWVNRMEDARAVLSPEWLALCEAVHHAADDDQRVQHIEDFLAPRWHQAHTDHQAQAQRYREWAEGLAQRAMFSGTGRSLRQIERRIRQWAGLPLRELRTLARAEAAFFAVKQLQDTATPFNWAEVAAEQGYADQSHLCRETRRITGCSPQELRRCINEEESFWSYRLWV